MSLSAEAQKLIHNMEVLGLPKTRAAELAGIANPDALLSQPEVSDARDKLKQHMRVSTAVTRETVIEGIKEAIEMARIINEPMPMIAGWTQIGKLLGFDKPQQVNITISGDVREMRRQIKALPEAELLQLADDSGIIDGDFYQVKGDE